MLSNTEQPDSTQIGNQKFSGPCKTENLSEYAIDNSETKTVVQSCEDYPRTEELPIVYLPSTGAFYVPENGNDVIAFVTSKMLRDTKSLRPICYVEKEFDSPYYVCFVDGHYLERVDKNTFSQRLRVNAQMDTKRVRVVERYGSKICFINHKHWEAETIGSMFGFVRGAISGAFDQLSYMRQCLSTVQTTDFKLFLIDLLAIMVELRDGYLTPMKFCSVLLSLYTSYHRFNKMFVAQTLGMSDVFVGLTMMGLPSAVIDGLKSFATITGKRVFDAEIISQALSHLVTAIRGIIRYMREPVDGLILLPESIATMLDSFITYVGGSFINYGLMREVVQVYTAYVRNPQQLFDPVYRESIVTLNERCINAPGFLEYATNVNNKYFNTTWVTFRDTLLKSTHAFDESRRDEPICFVFQGPAGSGKSTTMNLVVDLLRRAGRSVYCHTVPSTEDAKDFYDDYENQEVFVMDDVGQQGKSQWRSIINFVSPVKYPLACATASKKNTKFFNSKIILCTTNHLDDLNGFTSTDCITEPEALMRRIHLIKVNKNMAPGFSQNLTYWKFDHLGTKHWENTLLYHNADASMPVVCDTEGHPDGLRKSLAWVWSLMVHIEKCEVANRNRTQLPDTFFDEILSNQFYDAESWMDYHFDGSGLIGFKNIIAEWYELVSNCVTTFIEWAFKTLTLAVANFSANAPTLVVRLPNIFGLDGEIEISLHCILFCVAIICGVAYFCFGKSEDDVVARTFVDSVKEAKKRATEVYNYNQVAPDAVFVRYGAKYDNFEAQSNERTTNVRKFLKTLVVKHDTHDRSEDEVTQCVVSGKYVLLPAHLIADRLFCDVYHTIEHYFNKHKELENVRLRLVKMFPASDMAVYEFDGVIPLYKKCWNLFAAVNNNNPRMFLANSIDCFPVIYGSSIYPNKECVSYSKYTAQGVKSFAHGIDTGIITPLSGAGMCGTVLLSADNGIVGYHVAGNGQNGFCVVPPSMVAEEIRTIMLSGQEVNYELDSAVKPNFSGVRVRYEDKVEVTHVGDKTTLVKSVFHVDHNSDFKSFIDKLERDPRDYTTVPVEAIDAKGPPLYNCKGSPVKLLKEISQKTFKHQGFITSDEEVYIKACVKSMLCPFTDITDEECAFGGAITNPLNKDSSNGYGCLKGKESYFDFSEKIIKPEARDLFTQFKNAATKQDYDYSLFMCRETFKDELRGSTKRETPRTFRVMPLGHIWWTKKIFAQLMPHFKKNMHKFGCGVGMNPYVDFDIMARKLQACTVLGDIDFKQWDGSVMSHVMLLIGECMESFYEGSNVDVLRYVIKTMTTSFVLVSDEIWSTTHGLPSGTWLTLLMNCLINKVLTALTIYRNKQNATVNDFYSVVDYVMGDDKVFGSPKEMAKVFNLTTINAVAVSLGMTCTNGDKTPITKETQPFDKLSFIKRHFRQHPVLKGYVGVLSLDTILNTLQWVDETKDIEETMYGKMRSVQVEAYIHSPALFTQLTQVMSEQYPFAPLFRPEQVIKILTSPDGYVEVMRGLGKDMSFLNNM